jgi:heterotetrameric sarcosine oxidase gamma subunit
MRLTPLHERTSALGARYVELVGWRVPEAYVDVDNEIAQARAGVVLGDDSAKGRLLAQSAGIDDLLRRLIDPPELPVGAGQRLGGSIGDQAGGDRVADTGECWIYRLRADMVFVSTPPGGEGAMVARLQAAADSGASGLTTITDITDGRAEIRIVGPASAQLLSKVCALDFDDEVFSDGEAAQTSLAKTRQLILRRDVGSLPAYSIIGRRSLGAYVWSILEEAGGEWGIGPIGLSGLSRLVGD